MSYIEVENVTKDYGNGKGIFDVSFKIEKGEMFGFVGTNGAGKTTTIRHLLGFSKVDKGKIRVKNLDPWKSSYKLMKYIGYIPGEIAFPDLKTRHRCYKITSRIFRGKRFISCKFIDKRIATRCKRKSKVNE